MEVSNFNLRVYGLLIHNRRILITYEHRMGVDMIKFPGGGLEKGEGITDCLVREFKEELDVMIQPRGLFYVNDFLQVSAFNSKDQLISFYYFVEADKAVLTQIDALVDRLPENKDQQTFVWVSIEQLMELDFTFPIDRVVVEKLSEKGF